jgi:hypothetical protein
MQKKSWYDCFKVEIILLMSIRIELKCTFTFIPVKIWNQ